MSSQQSGQINVKKRSIKCKTNRMPDNSHINEITTLNQYRVISDAYRVISDAYINKLLDPNSFPRIEPL